jgi:hypothetical protein
MNVYSLGNSLLPSQIQKTNAIFCEKDLAKEIVTTILLLNIVLMKIAILSHNHFNHTNILLEELK